MQRQQEQNKRPVVDHIKLNIWYVKLYLYSPFFYYYMYMYMRFLLKFCVSFSACKYRIRRGTDYRGTLTVTMNIYIFICNHTKYNIEKNAQFGTSFVAYLSIEG